MSILCFSGLGESTKEPLFGWQCHSFVQTALAGEGEEQIAQNPAEGIERCLLLVRVVIPSNSNHRGSASHRNPGPLVCSHGPGCQCLWGETPPLHSLRESVSTWNVLTEARMYFTAIFTAPQPICIHSFYHTWLLSSSFFSQGPPLNTTQGREQMEIGLKIMIHSPAQLSPPLHYNTQLLRLS